MLLFASATQGWWLVRNKIWESAILLLVAFTLFRPGFWMDMVAPPYNEVAPTEIQQAAEATPAGEYLRLRIAGLNDLGDPIEFVALLTLPEGASGEEKLEKKPKRGKDEGDANDNEADGKSSGDPKAEAGEVTNAAARRGAGKFDV